MNPRAVKVSNAKRATQSFRNIYLNKYKYLKNECFFPFLTIPEDI